MNALDVIEKRARELAGGIHARGAIPAQSWRKAIAERFPDGRVQYESEEERVNRVMRDVLRAHVVKLEAEAHEKGWA